MAQALQGSTFKFKQFEIAYDSLMNLNLYNIADQVAEIMSKHGYAPKIVGNKYKFKYVR